MQLQKKHVLKKLCWIFKPLPSFALHLPFSLYHNPLSFFKCHVLPTCANFVTFFFHGNSANFLCIFLSFYSFFFGRLLSHRVYALILTCHRRSDWSSRKPTRKSVSQSWHHLQLQLCHTTPHFCTLSLGVSISLIFFRNANSEQPVHIHQRISAFTFPRRARFSFRSVFHQAETFREFFLEDL